MVSSWNLFVFLFLFFLSFTATVAGKDSHHSHHEHHAPSSDSPSSVDGHLAKRICIDPNPDDPICSPSRSGIGVASGGGEGHIVVGLVDCFGQPNGKAVVDRCGVCGGNGTTCLDCLGVPRGTHRYDACGVCGGNSRMCVDCKGVCCGVCGGGW